MDSAVDNKELIIVSCLAAVVLTLAFCFGPTIVRRCPRMLPLPVQSWFMYCALFTLGIGLLGTRASLLVPFGIVFAFVGIAIFLPEKIVLPFVGPFLFALCIALLSLLHQLRSGTPLVQPQRLSLTSASVFVLLWGVGIAFAWRRWWDSRTQLPPKL